jgi:hypothetical protein
MRWERWTWPGPLGRERQKAISGDLAFGAMNVRLSNEVSNFAHPELDDLAQGVSSSRLSWRPLIIHEVSAGSKRCSSKCFWVQLLWSDK